MKHNADFTHDLDFGQVGESKVAELLDNGLTEVKSERAESWEEEKKWVTTGNHFVEYESRNKPSGIQTTKAKWWFVNFMVGDEVMFGKYILVERLIEKLAVMKKEDRLKIVKGGDSNSSWGYLFPIKEFDTK
jgi:hypothetical protein